MTVTTPAARANARARNRARNAALRQLSREHPDAARIARDWLDITEPGLPADTRRQRAFEWVARTYPDRMRALLAEHIDTQRRST